MLFNSPEFLFAFVPVTMLGYYLLLKFSGSLSAQFWLFAASLFFYGWWNPVYLPLLCLSMAFNYLLGQKLQTRPDGRLLAAGVAANLALLGYFKYCMFFQESLNYAFDAGIEVSSVILPLGISFFTFQKIAYLVDSHRGQVPKDQNWINFGLFVSFFPQLIAGPIVHHKEMMPQFAREHKARIDGITAGLCLIAIGLFKKVIIADSLEVYATPLFAAAETRDLHIVEAWVAMLSYTFQIYFDFSGYCDMALGLGKLFGIRLPVNFYSPYKAKNIIDFWRRWHMTLSRFLRDYLYIALGGNRKGPTRRYVNLMATMLLGGLWHGAGWTFVIWGGLHGLYLTINHFWRGLPEKMRRIPPWVAHTVTFLAVAVAWVFFRAESVSGAWSVISSLVRVSDMEGLPIDRALFSKLSPLRATFDKQTANIAGMLIPVCLLICLFMPNSVEIMRRGKPAVSGIRGFPLPRTRIAEWMTWRPNLRWGLIAGGILAICAVKVLYEPSQVFLYFQF